MKDIRVRAGLEMLITAKDGWAFVYGDDNELSIRRDDVTLPVDRDIVITVILYSAELATRRSDELPWYVSFMPDVPDAPSAPEDESP